MNHLAQYIAAALLNSANDSGNSKARLSSFIREDYEIYRGSISKIVENLMSQFGPHITEKDVDEALNLLSFFAAAEAEFSPAAKAFWNIKFDNFRYYFIESEPDLNEDDVAEYHELRRAAENEAILMAYARNGSAYIEDAIEHIARMSEDDINQLRQSSLGFNYTPASDRMVSLQHNQQEKIETAATEVIDAVDKLNSVDGNNALRQAILGQLKAGRELIRAGVFKVVLIEWTLINALQVLIKKYENELVGALAAALLTELLKVIAG